MDELEKMAFIAYTYQFDDRHEHVELLDPLDLSQFFYVDLLVLPFLNKLRIIRSLKSQKDADWRTYKNEMNEMNE